MRKIITLLILVMLGSMNLVEAQVKVISKSAKKIPAWVHYTGADFIVTSAEAPTLEEAKNECLERVKRAIVSAVAENVKSFSSSNISQEMNNDQITKFIQTYDQTYATRSATLPFLSGISQTKVEDYYYEQQQDHRTDKTTWFYAIKYPFSDGQLKGLIAQFDKMDSQMQQELELLTQQAAAVVSTEQIDQGIAQLRILQGYFFDETRQSKTRSAIELYNKLYTYITPVLVASKPGELQFMLTLDGRVIRSATRATFKSACAEQFAATAMNREGIIFVTYDDQGCLAGEDNYVDVNFRIGGHNIKQRMFIELSSDPLGANIEGDIFVKLGQQKDSLTYEGVELIVTINNGSNKELHVESLNLTMPILRTPLSIEGISVPLAQGVHQVKFLIPETVVVNLDCGDKLPMARGTMTVRNKDTDLVKNLVISAMYR